MTNRQPSDSREALYHELLERDQRLHQLIGQLLDQGRVEGGRKTAHGDSKAIERLAPREIEMLRLLASGCTNREIGDRLKLGAGTVRNYLGRIFRKLGASSRTQAAVRAVELGLVKPSHDPAFMQRKKRRNTTPVS